MVQVHPKFCVYAFLEENLVTRLSTKDFVNYAPIILNMLVIQEAELSPAF